MFYSAPPLQLWANSMSSASSSWMVVFVKEPVYAWTITVCCIIASALQSARMKSSATFMGVRRQQLNESIALLGKMFKRQQRLINLRKKQ